MLNLQTYQAPSESHIATEIQSALNLVLNSKNIGFIDLPHRAELWNQSEKLGSEIRNHYDHLIVVGIGGSSMGPRALAEFSGNTNISFLDNVDSIETENVLKNKHNLQFFMNFYCSAQILWEDSSCEYFFEEDCFIELHHHTKSCHY